MLVRAVAHHPDEPAGLADERAEAVGRELALEGEDVRAAPQQSLHRHVETVALHAGAKIETAAMGRVGSDVRAPQAEARRGAGEETTLCAVPVHHVGLPHRQLRLERADGGKVPRTGRAAHGNAQEAETQARGKRAERRVGAGSALGVADHADGVARLRLGAGDVEYVPEQPADGCAEDVDDAQARIRGGGHLRTTSRGP